MGDGGLGPAVAILPAAALRGAISPPAAHALLRGLAA